jgi:hypothetical protein
MTLKPRHTPGAFFHSSPPALRENAAYRGLARGSVVVSRGAIARPARLPYGRADAANKTIGLHKLLHCVGTPEQARWGHMESTAYFPAIFFAAIIAVIVFIALGKLLLEPHE